MTSRNSVTNLRLPTRISLLEQIPKGGLAVEVGVLRGVMATWIKRIIDPSCLVLIDMWQGTYQCFDQNAAFQHVQRLFMGDPSVEIWRGRSDAMIPELADRSVDFAYVDADHTFEGCLTDLELLLPKMKPGGWLCGHDYCQGFDYGVVRAVAVFCDRYKQTISLMTDEVQHPWRGSTGNQPKMLAYNSFGIRIHHES